MNIQDILTIYNYNYWANKIILDTSAKVAREQFDAPASFPFGSLRGTLFHILDTEWGWRTLLQYNDPTGPDLDIKDFPTPVALQERWAKEEQDMRAYLAGLRDEDLGVRFHYTNYAGEPRSRVLWHCLLHVVNHGTQHRGEAAALLTEYGQSPGDLDFTLFLDENKL
jgi:uncharacterized damage-inducible protein DinB